VLQRLGTAAERTLFVAGSASDVPGAKGVGMPVYWHNRVGLPPRDDAPARLISDIARPLAGRPLAKCCLQWSREEDEHVAEATSSIRPSIAFGPTHWFEDLEVGQKFYINSRTQTEALFAAFQLASGDNHPIHYDREYCKARGHRDMLAHGCRWRSRARPAPASSRTVIGDSLIGFLEQSSRFLKPVYCGDTLYPLLEVS
jgi:acyl dehydratase